MIYNCPLGSYPSGSSYKCYTYYNELKNYADSITFCQSKQSYPPVIENKFENNDFSIHLLGTTWIGASDQVQERNFVWATTLLSISYSNWNYGEPSNYDYKDCVEIGTNSNWYDSYCYALRYVACFQCAAGYEWNSDLGQCTACPLGSHSAVGSSCISCSAGTEWNSASSKCSTCPTNFYSFSGSPCIPCPTGYHSVAGSDCFLCSSGTTWDIYTSKCVKCLAGTEWDPSTTQCIDCSAGYYSIADSPCQQCPSGTYSFDSGSSSCTQCPLGYFSSIKGSSSINNCNYPISCPSNTIGPSPEGKCYQFNSEMKSYLDSMNYCYSQNKFLPIILSKEENQFITKKLIGNSWINLDDLTNSLVWSEVGISPVYTNWGIGEPSNSNPNEDCTIINFNGLWSVVNCNDLYKTTCSQCAIGTQLTSDGRCSLCPKGYYSIDGGCKVCPIGRYSTNYGQTSCLRCPSGSSSYPGSSSCYSTPTLAPTTSQPTYAPKPTYPVTSPYQCSRYTANSLEEMCEGLNCALGLTIIGKGYDITKAFEDPSKSITKRIYEFSDISSSFKLDGITYSVPPKSELQVEEWDYIFPTMNELSKSYDSVKSYSTTIGDYIGLGSTLGIAYSTEMARKVSTNVDKNSYTWTHYSAVTKAKYSMKHPFPNGYNCEMSFFEDLEGLPQEYDFYEYRDFLMTHGTHVIVGAKVGGYISQSMSRSAKKYRKRTKVEADASTFRDVIGDFTVNSKENERIIFDETLNRNNSFVCGGNKTIYTSPASSKTNWDAWVDTLTTNPLCPLHLTLIPISDLVNDPTIRENLVAVVEEYLKDVVGDKTLSTKRVKPKKK